MSIPPWLTTSISTAEARTQKRRAYCRSAALAKELGFETFVVDAMWFPQSGAWYWDPKRFPHGHKPIEEYLHSHDMKFGLWMAYTHGSSLSDPRALNIKEHPDWFSAPPKLDPEGHINWDALIDLGYDPARDWAEQSTQRVVAEYGIDYFKTDYSPIVTQCQQTNHRHHYGVDVSYWSTLGYYAVQEALLQKFPNLINEGCSGSGHIKDFGDIQRVHTIAINDTLSSLPNRQAIYDSTFAFPPAALMDYTYENFYDTVSDAPEPYFWRSSMMNQWQIDPTHSASWTPEQRANVKRATDIYKSWIRPILQDVEVHHILPRPDGYHWDGMFYWSPSLKRGTLYIFRPDSEQRYGTHRVEGACSGHEVQGTHRRSFNAGGDLLWKRIDEYRASDTVACPLYQRPGLSRGGSLIGSALGTAITSAARGKQGTSCDAIEQEGDAEQMMPTAKRRDPHAGCVASVARDCDVRIFSARKR